MTSTDNNPGDSPAAAGGSFDDLLTGNAAYAETFHDGGFDGR